MRATSAAPPTLATTMVATPEIGWPLAMANSASTLTGSSNSAGTTKAHSAA
jgi:hypothetical protein